VTATATALNYTLSADGTTITDAALTFDGDRTGRSVKAGFGTDNLTTCTDNLTTCTVGT
jgi:hypothetical protein